MWCMKIWKGKKSASLLANLLQDDIFKTIPDYIELKPRKMSSKGVWNPGS